MRLITFEEKDAVALLEQLTLASFKTDPSQVLSGSNRDQLTVGDMHRKFHYIVTRWLQEQGASGIRH